VFAVAQRGPGGQARQGLLQQRFPVEQGRSREIEAVEMEKVEDMVVEAMATPRFQVRLQVAEMRDPAVVLRNDLAVEQRLVDAEHFERRRNGRKARGPIERFSRQQKNLATVDPRLDPVAIVLDLVNPGRSARRLVGQQRQTRLEEGRQPAGLGSRNRRRGGLSFGTCSARAAHSAISRRVRRKAYSMTRTQRRCFRRARRNQQPHRNIRKTQSVSAKTLQGL
jgi:hypothetical protein